MKMKGGQMGQLDKLIERIQPAQELLLESQKEPMMRSSSGTKIMVNQQLSSPQILALLADLAPVDQKHNFLQKKPTTFGYALEEKHYTVSFLTQGDLVRGVISLAGQTESEPTADVADAAAADDEFSVAAVEGDEEETVEVITAKPAPSQKPARPAAGNPEVNVLLRQMVQMGASDLHLTANHKPLVRLHGDMQEISNQPVLTPERLKKMIYGIMPAHNTAQFEDIHDTDYAHEIPGVARFRVNIFMDRFGIGAVFRQIPMEIVTAEKLGLSKVLDLCFLSKGLVLVTGPTGSGKSTTRCAPGGP